MYCAFEGAHGYKKRIEALRRHYDIEPGTDVPLFVMPGQANLIVEHKLLIWDIAAQLGEVTPCAVVLDTLNKSLFGSENKDVDMATMCARPRRSATSSAASSSSSTLRLRRHSPRGHSSLPGAVDAQLAVTRQERS